MIGTVTAAMKREAFALFGYAGYNDPRCVPDGHERTFEIDNVISRALGDADVVDNIYPNSCGSPWIAHTKGKLENGLTRASPRRFHNKVQSTFSRPELAYRLSHTTHRS